MLYEGFEKELAIKMLGQLENGLHVEKGNEDIAELVFKETLTYIDNDQSLDYLEAFGFYLEPNQVREINILTATQFVITQQLENQGEIFISIQDPNEIANELEYILGKEFLEEEFNNDISDIDTTILKLKEILLGILVSENEMLSEEEKIGFDFEGVWIENPLLDETARFDVNPFEYYGMDNINSLLEEFLGGN